MGRERRGVPLVREPTKAVRVWEGQVLVPADGVVVHCIGQGARMGPTSCHGGIGVECCVPDDYREPDPVVAVSIYALCHTMDV